MNICKDHLPPINFPQQASIGSLLGPGVSSGTLGISGLSQALPRVWQPLSPNISMSDISHNISIPDISHNISISDISQYIDKVLTSEAGSREHQQLYPSTISGRKRGTNCGRKREAEESPGFPRRRFAQLSPGCRDAPAPGITCQASVNFK